MLTSVGCFGGSRAATPILELFRKPALPRERRIANNVHWFAYARVALETMYAASGKIVRLGWLAHAKRVAGSSDLTVTHNSSFSVRYCLTKYVGWNAHAIIITSCFSIN